MTQAPARAWVPAFVIAATSWGSSFLFISLALRGLDPVQVGFGRVLIGAAVLWTMLLVTRHRPRLSRGDVARIGVVALGLSTVPFVLIPLAQQHITSILASLLNATTPLWTALFVALLIPHERASRAQVAGLVLGAAGIGVLLGAWNVDGIPLLGAALMLGATACYGIGSTMSRMLLTRVHEGPTALSAVQIAISAVLLLPVALVAPAPDPGVLALSSEVLWGLLALGVLGTSFTYVMFWRVVKLAGATTAASVTYVVPVVATVLGILVLHEELRWHEPVGAVIVLAGVWLAQRTPRPRPSAEGTAQVAIPQGAAQDALPPAAPAVGAETSMAQPDEERAEQTREGDAGAAPA
ncbi:DMT family transporter [Demequina rhizosphaerae]|uniref:DMT family transporter n=1 Tax=Demequina rhizosphaerae TaxID=1638985 RepID=UPI000784B800|nr:DMT family transporter [Demequina rhizosphaerae]